MYNALTSFFTFLRNSILPQLGSGVALYTDDNVEASFPAVFVRELQGVETDVNALNAIELQFDVISNDYDRRGARILIDKLLDKLDLINDRGGNYTKIYDYTNPVTSGTPPVTSYTDTGKTTRWMIKRHFRALPDRNNPEFTRYTFDIILYY